MFGITSAKRLPKSCKSLFVLALCSKMISKYVKKVIRYSLLANNFTFVNCSPFPVDVRTRDDLDLLAIGRSARRMECPRRILLPPSRPQRYGEGIR